jgi:hypothetical protein
MDHDILSFNLARPRCVELYSSLGLSMLEVSQKRGIMLFSDEKENELKAETCQGERQT